MKFTYGITTKTVHGRRYTYFWKYQGTGRKNELYIGPEDKPSTRIRALRTELKYLEELQEELTVRIFQLKADLAEKEPSEQQQQDFQKTHRKKT